MFGTLRVVVGLALIPGGVAWAAGAGFDREVVLAPQSGPAGEDREIARWQGRAAEAGAGREAFERLGWAYVAKARRTQDAGYYLLAEKTAGVIVAEFGANPDAALLRGHAAHNLHRFEDAERIARALVAERGGPADLALLSDALMERGNLTEAVAILQRLEGIKPGPESGARIAQVRWLKGDIDGAVAATTAALRGLHPAERATRAWFLVRLSALELQRGNLTVALRLAEEAGDAAAEYPPGWYARGRALVALEQWGAAAEALRHAMKLQPAPEHAWWLADVLTRMGLADEAARWARWLEERGAAEDARTTALWLATQGRDGGRALRLARAELRGRGDVFSHDAHAWALLANGDHAGANEAMRAALAEGTRDARLFLHAGEVAGANGDAVSAAAHFAAAAAMPHTLTPAERVRLARNISFLKSQ